MEIIVIVVIFLVIAYYLGNYESKYQSKKDDHKHHETTYSQRTTTQKPNYQINEDSALKFGESIVTKVVGVTFENRQEIIKNMKVGERIQLVQEPENIYDKNAVKVVRVNGEQIGYIKKEIAGGIHTYVDMIVPFPTYAEVLDIIGDPKKDQSLGVVIEIIPPTEGEVLAASDMRYPRF